MADNYTQVAGESGLVCSKDQAGLIFDLLNNEHDDHGFQFVWEPRPGGDDGLGYFEAEVQGTIEEVPIAALQAIGKLIEENHLPYLECGVAWTCSKMRPGEFGGTAFRIYPDGTQVCRLETWPDRATP